LNGLDDGTVNVAWLFDPARSNGHTVIHTKVNRVSYGTQIIIKPGGG
jgi:hypothetical protein